MVGSILPFASRQPIRPVEYASRVNPCWMNFVCRNDGGLVAIRHIIWPISNSNLWACRKTSSSEVRWRMTRLCSEWMQPLCSSSILGTSVSPRSHSLCRQPACQGAERLFLSSSLPPSFFSLRHHACDGILPLLWLRKGHNHDAPAEANTAIRTIVIPATSRVNQRGRLRR